ncbi:hypothetical protein H6P81_003475 [Aristolochia fimbriata]|uniref:Small auxin up regulated protein n=1 Tax=Aristolochia fimbriata TaxID=158543 RepID=A0AAV7FG00_ARIFI|nr:hypothetical protein H6P81_003475 [Aristolochia fimbriata]
MGIHLPGIHVHAKQIIRRSASKERPCSRSSVPRGHFAVYVGESKKRFVIPISFLKHPLFRRLLSMTEEEFGFGYQNGGLVIPCDEETFAALTSHLYDCEV